MNHGSCLICVLPNMFFRSYNEILEFMLSQGQFEVLKHKKKIQFERM